MTLRLPDRILHVDWSMDPRKRWAAEGHLRGGAFYATAPKCVTPDQLLGALAPRTLMGFDFPIGIPRDYGTKASISSFVPWLSELGKAPWAKFFDVADSANDISLYRPFYPHATGRKGEKLRDDLCRALNMESDGLYRRCEAEGGRTACPLFWTLGGNQVGKGALTGWKEVIRPAHNSNRARLWPFQGSLEHLLDGDRGVIVETYPGDTYGYVGATLPETGSGSDLRSGTKTKGPPTKGKRSAASRMASAPSILRWAAEAGIIVDNQLRRDIEAGFGHGKDGEDPFDAVAGLFAMIAVVTSRRPIGIPEEKSDRAIHHLEGWILGRPAV